MNSRNSLDRASNRQILELSILVGPLLFFSFFSSTNIFSTIPIYILALSLRGPGWLNELGSWIT